MSNRRSLTVNDLINDNVKLNRAAFAAVREFRRSKPWRGTFEERLEKFMKLTTGLGEAYGVQGLELIFQGEESLMTLGDGKYDPKTNRIILVRKLSVVTLLHCMAAARGYTARERFAWSLSVFKKMFPVSFSRCHAVGIFLVR